MTAGSPRSRRALAAACLLVALLPRLAGAEETERGGNPLGRVWGDARWAGRTAWADAVALATAPLRVREVTEISSQQVITGALLLAGLGAAFALDETIRSEGRTIDDHAASTLQTTASTISLASLGVLYGAGFVMDDERWRHESLTGAEGVAVSSALVKVTKLAFGRERPDSGRGSTAFFKGGDSFVSDAATPPFAAAEAVSAAFDHAWWVTVPSYGMAAAVGVGRIGQDRHWASDIVASAYLGAGTTALFDFLHRRDEAPAGPSLRISPLVSSTHAPGIGLALRF